MTTTTVRNPLAHLPGGAGLVRAVRTRRGARILSWLSLLAAWQIIVPFLGTDLVPMPAEVAGFMWDELRGDTVAPYTVYESFGLSFERLATGLLIAFAVGVPAGLLMGLYRPAEHLLHDFTVAGLAMPSLVWALVAGMWFGFGNTAPLITVALAALPFVVINVAEGVRDVPKDLLDMSAAYGVHRRPTIRHVVLPSLMPFFFAALRYGLANAWKGLVLAEVWASTTGAGWVIKFWYDAHRPYGIVGYALFFVLVAIVIERMVFGRLSARVFRWRPDNVHAAGPEGGQ
jgi:NitT/TauT family transport system permease protein